MEAIHFFSTSFTARSTWKALSLGPPIARKGIPDGIEVMHYDSNNHAGVVSGFRDNYLWEEFLKSDPVSAAQVAAAKECVVLQGIPANSANLNYLRDTVGLITHFLGHGGLCVYDPQMFHWWTPERWRERIFMPDGPVPRHHVIILTSPQESLKLTWFHTRGLRKFGRPDLSITNVPRSHHTSAIDLCNRFIEHQAFGAVIPERHPIRMASLPSAMTCRYAGNVDNPDFNNVHLEIKWPDCINAERQQ